MSDDSKPGPSGSSSGSKGKCETRSLADIMMDGGFAVYPLPWCPHLESLPESPVANVKVTSKCQECNDSEENWLCLCCETTHCSR